MSPVLGAAVAGRGGCVIGSIPGADLVTRRDLRELGDRNPGYWNAKETLGRRAALPVFVGDVVKGAAAAGVGVLLAPAGDWWVGYVAGFAAMVGHAWPVFARFRGGRNVPTFAGARCVVSPVAAAISIGVLLVVLAATRSFAWGARAGIVVFPFVQIVVEGPYRTAATGCLMTLIGVRFAQAALVSRTSGRATSAGA